jgi:7-carboxy-7-deazaguanine synthase
MKDNLKIVEIFYSLQGEGGNVGMPAIFIRLSNCNLDCWFCDTDWSKGTTRSIDSILEEIKQYNCKTIIWTGGEPTLQLTKEILVNFSDYYNCIETNGTNRVPDGIDYITCSPKIPARMLKQNFPNGVDEFRFPIMETLPPSIGELPKATNYFVSPIFLGDEKQRFQMDEENVNKCINFVKENEGWKLSLQTHKLLNIR